ncbi:double zinc ribbon domain-containing protein [Pseudomonas sp. dw_358]|uniref:ComF family protein n=1 Tax=Pseudomonas sp. dw_358 TaxID=2720083 RepID=UPI001BD66F63|nr:double zinc ribbon domain-containing protein [Pseudomonas sp. dw_358]
MRCQPYRALLVYKWLLNNQLCLLCDEPCHSPTALCEPCTQELPWLRERCRLCALPLAMEGLVCGQCSRRRPAFARVEAPWEYRFPVDGLITRFKHKACWPLGRLLGELLGQWLQQRFEDGLARPDRLIAVPLGSRRLRLRGFNQAQMLAAWLAKSLGIACDTRSLVRRHETRAQQDLGARARQRNLRQAFHVQVPTAVEGLHIAVVDDVLTTGATAQVIARCLRDAGARRVDIYCLARTAKPGHA